MRSWTFRAKDIKHSMFQCLTAVQGTTGIL